MRWAVLWVILLGLVLVPFFLFEEHVNGLAARVTTSGVSLSFAAMAIFFLLALDVFLPVPSSVVATGAGVLLGFVRGAAVVFAGMLAGSLIAYALGRKASGAATWIVGADSLRRAEAVVRRYGDAALVVCRPIPVLAEASVVFAGLVRVPAVRVAWLTGLANLGIAIGYAGFGAYSMRIDSFVVAFAGALLLPAVALGLARLVFGRSSFASDRARM